MDRFPSDRTSPLRKRGAALPGVAVAAFVGILYAKTLAPTVLRYGGADTLDSAMLQAGVFVLGIGHPTGYPTYMMLTHLFTYLPVGDPAYRVNLASAVYGAAAVFVVYLVGSRLSRRAVPAAAGALAFGLSGVFWSQAVIAEVYTLEALLVALVLLVLLLWRDRREDRYLLLAALLVGLSLTHHLTSVLLVPASLAFVVLVDRGVFTRTRPLLHGLGLFLLGLLPLLYLPVRAIMEAPLNEADPSTPGRLLLLVTGGSFLAESSEEGRQCTPSVLALADPSAKLQVFGEQVFGQFFAIFVLVGALAAVYLIFADHAVAVLLGTISFGCLAQSLVYLQLGIEDFYVFLIPVWLALSLCVSVGLGILLRSVEDLSVGPVARQVLVVALLSLMLAVPLLGAREEYDVLDRSEDFGGSRMVESVARNTQRGATVLHHRSSLWYMVLVEGRRRDLTLIDPFCTSWDRHTDVVWPDPISAAQADARYRTGDTSGVGAAREAAKNGPVYVLAQKKIEIERFSQAGFDAIPIGEDRLLYELKPR
jgi:hypothetical protein